MPITMRGHLKDKSRSLDEIVQDWKGKTEKGVASGVVGAVVTGVAHAAHASGSAIPSSTVDMAKEGFRYWMQTQLGIDQKLTAVAGAIASEIGDGKRLVFVSEALGADAKIARVVNSSMTFTEADLNYHRDGTLVEARPNKLELPKPSDIIVVYVPGRDARYKSTDKIKIVQCKFKKNEP